MNLLTTNTGSDHSMVDDEASTNSEEKRAKSEVNKSNPNRIFIFLLFCFLGIIGGWIQKLCVWYATSNFSDGCSSSWAWENEGGES